MPNLNKIMLMGNLTRDPECKYTPKGMAITQIGVAVNRVWLNDAGEKQEEVTFIDVEFFGKKAEVVGEHFKKGRSIFVEGRLKLDSWTDKESNQKKSKLKVVGESFEFMGGPKQDDDRTPAEQHAARQKEVAARPPQRIATRPAPPRDPDLDGDDNSDIPF